jgi:F-type H+-transporting ATPase subunit epsilon
VAEATSDQTILLEIVTPVRRVFAEAVNSIVIPGHDGYFGVLPRHTPLLAEVRIGDIKVGQGGKTLHFATSGGVVEVLPDNVKILVESAEEASTIDVERAEAARERARKRLAEGRKQWEMARAEASLARATNRLRVVEFYKESLRTKQH